MRQDPKTVTEFRAGIAEARRLLSRVINRYEGAAAFGTDDDRVLEKMREDLYSVEAIAAELLGATAAVNSDLRQALRKGVVRRQDAARVSYPSTNAMDNAIRSGGDA